MAQAGIIGALLAGSYLLGAIPFGLWLVKQWKGVDIRTVGSGNIGSTNVGRVAGPLGYVLSFTFDMLKGLLPPLVAIRLGLASEWQIAGALMAIIGHNYSVFLGFKGGKGIATSLGALLGVAPLVGIAALLVFLVEVITLNWVSLGSILAAISLPLFTLWFYPGYPYRLAFALAACGMAVYKHRANIQRLRAGIEPKVCMPWQKPKGQEKQRRKDAQDRGEEARKREEEDKGRRGMQDEE